MRDFKGQEIGKLVQIREWHTELPSPCCREMRKFCGKIGEFSPNKKCSQLNVPVLFESYTYYFPPEMIIAVA